MTPGFGTVLRIELERMRRQPLTWVLGLIAVGFMALIQLALVAVLAGPPQEGLDPALILGPYRQLGAGYAAALFAGVAGILVVVLGGQAAGGEFSRGTMRTLLANGVGRRALVAAKLAAILVAAAVAALVGAVLAVASAYAMGLAVGEWFLDAGAASLARIPLGLFVALGAWGAFACLTTFAARSQAAGIGSTLGLLIVGDVVSGMIAALGEAGRVAQRALPNWAVGTLASTSDADAGLLATAAITLAAWLGALSWLALWRTQRADAIAVTR